MNQSQSHEPGGPSGRPLSPEARLLLDIAVRAMARRADLAPAPQSQLKYAPDDICELAFAACQLAFFVLSSDLTECFVCGASGATMGEPANHHPLCKVARVWRSVDALKITTAVQP